MTPPRLASRPRLRPGTLLLICVPCVLFVLLLIVASRSTPVALPDDRAADDPIEQEASEDPPSPARGESGEAVSTPEIRDPDPGVSSDAGLGRRMAVGEDSQGPLGMEQSESEHSNHDRVHQLLTMWTEQFGLDSQHAPHSVPAPDAVPGPSAAPRPPHLQECSALTERRKEWEEHSTAEGQGGFPRWACASGADTSPQFCRHPSPPWVRGADAENLNMTRVVQRDLWAAQFPANNCSSTSLKFLLVDWWPMHHHGIGSEIHLMSSVFAIAYAAQRILVPTPHTFHRANHKGCEREGNRGTLDCYFFPMTSPHCMKQALSLYKSISHLNLTYQELSVEYLATAPRVVRMFRIRDEVEWVNKVSWRSRLQADAALSWGTPWAELEQESPFELLGSTLQQYQKDMAQATWWRSQSVRFMLRWPTAYLCHFMNKARHGAYGFHVARRVAAAEEWRQKITAQGLKEGFLDASEVAMLQENPPAGMGTQGQPLEMTDAWRLAVDAYMPRPIISMHVRQGDKAQEMRLFSLASYMWLAERVRLLVPGVDYIWLSTEMQSVVDETARFPHWTFLYSRMLRQNGTTAMIEYERQVGMEQEVGSSFANLLIAAECDLFVGVLGSNWNRLINELRLTSGRKRASYMALNNDEY